jgi:hypothetical protein
LKPIYGLLARCSQRGDTHDTTTIGRSYSTSFKWAWNENKPKLFTLITSNKYIQEYTKNFDATTKAIKAQFPKWVIDMITS